MKAAGDSKSVRNTSNSAPNAPRTLGVDHKIVVRESAHREKAFDLATRDLVVKRTNCGQHSFRRRRVGFSPPPRPRSPSRQEGGGKAACFAPRGCGAKLLSPQAGTRGRLIAWNQRRPSRDRLLHSDDRPERSFGSDRLGVWHILHHRLRRFRRRVGKRVQRSVIHWPFRAQPRRRCLRKTGLARCTTPSS